MNEADIKAKIRGLISGIQSFNASERDKYPSDKFADNYNRILDSAHEFVEGEVLPPRADTIKLQMRGTVSTMSFCEMLAHLHELRELMDIRLGVD